MVLSVLDINKNKENEVKYNDHKFVKIGNRWTTYINNNKITVAYLPKDVENINVDVSYGDLSYATKIYLSYNPEQALLTPVQELMLNKNIIGIAQQFVLACPSDNELCKSENLPIKACRDASDSTGVVLFELANNTNIEFNNNCLQLTGTPEEITKIIDKLTLKRLGII